MIEDKLNYYFDEVVSCEPIGTFEDEYVYDVQMADETHTFIANDILVHNSLYCCYGDLFKTFSVGPTTDEEKLAWLLRFNKEFLDKWNNEQLDKRFNSRHGRNIHEFELETVAKSGIFLAKKKYTQMLVFSKGNYYLDKPKVKGKGAELIKAQTPALAREILTKLADIMMTKFDSDHKNNFAWQLSIELKKHLQRWMEAPIEEISMSGNIGTYSSAVRSDDGILDVDTHAGLPTKGIALYNFMCNKRGESNLCVYSGKIKYYYISTDNNKSDVFSFPAGEYPLWAPEPARYHQFQKCVIDPINRFCTALDMPLMNINCSPQLTMF